MSEQHVTAELLQRLRRQELASAELLNALRHLGRCSECAHAANGLLPSRLTLEDDADDEPEHLDPETQLFPWVDGTLDAAGREIVETHLEDCAMCRAEAEDLREWHRGREKWRGGRFGHRRPKRPPLHLWAAAALVVVVSIVVVNRRPPAPVEKPPAPRPVVRTAMYANGEWNALVAEAIRTRRLPLAAGLDELRPAADPLRGNPGGEAVALWPAGVFVATARPRFRWPAADGKATYAVAVFDGNTQVAASEELTATEWTPPSDLPAERTLAWQVEVTRGGKRVILPAPPAPPALFRIAEAAHRAALEAARAQHPDDHLLHAVLYARAGLAAEADAALQRAAAAGDRRSADIARPR